MFRVSGPRTAALLAAFGIAGVVGCGGAPPPAALTAEARPYIGPPVPLRVDAPFYIPGEAMYWELSLHGIVGGEAAMAMGQPGVLDGRRVIVVRSRVESTGVAKLIKKVKDDVTTWVDLDRALPVMVRGDLKFGDRETRVQTQFRPGGYDIEYQRRGKRLHKRRQNIPAAGVVHDSHSVLGVLRAWTPEEGTRAYFYVLGGRRLWHNQILFSGREAIKTSMGLFPAIRIDGVATRLTGRLSVDSRKKPRSYTVWISDDANRVPLRLTARTEYGDIRAELIDYDRPARVIARR